MTDSQNRLEAALAGKYRIEQELGQGGMATVYRAHDHRHQRTVALKVLRPDLAALLAPDRFLREIATTARLAHPGIVPLFDSGTDQGITWYTMPLATGKTLRERLAGGRPLPLAEALRIFADVAAALDYAHRHGVLHRDLKPANILLQEDRALLADFGIALPVGEGATRLTEMGLSVGTPEYMSPEQAAGERSLDARSDVYALGCVLYEMLTGEPPFTGASARAVLAKRLLEPVPKLGTLRDTPPAIEAAVTRALNRDPADRFGSVGEFAQAVEEPPPDDRRQVRIRPRAIVGIAAIATVLLLSARWFMTQERTAPRAAPTRRVDSAALAEYAEGQDQLHRRTQAGLTRAVELFGRAIRRDSGFALGWAGLAQAMGWARAWEYAVPGVPAESLLTRELAASDRALALDSTNLDMWLLRAEVATEIDPTRREPAINALQRALALDSLSREAWSRLGWALEHGSDRDRAGAAMRKAVALGENPVALANHHYWSREFDSAAVWADSAVIMNPRLPWAHETVGAVALARGRLADAEAAYQAARRLDIGPTAVRSLEGLAEVAARRGDTAGARRFIRVAEGLADPVTPSAHAAISLGSAWGVIDQPDRALAWLEQFQPRGDLHFQLHLKRDPMLDPLRSQPRFQALLRQPESP